MLLTILVACMLATDLTAAVKTLEEQKLDLEEQASTFCSVCVYLGTGPTLNYF